jgi:hypothetical protein
VRAKDSIRLSEVYGIARDLPKNYVPREKIDGTLMESLTRDKHIVIYGSSKQGKTCLRKYVLMEDDYIVVTCSNQWGLAQLHVTILKRAGYTVEQTTTRTAGGDTKIAAKFGGRAKLGFIELSGETGGDRAANEKVETTEVALELDPTDVNDIISALQSIEFNKYIVLEDFHYLSDDTQKDFAVALKAFHEASPYCFIVVGVWLDQNRLIQFNGDLTGRIITINADAWSRSELYEVINEGAQLLNINFDEGFKHDLVAGCFESVYVVQETCYRACKELGITTSQAKPRTIGDGLSAAEIIRQVVDDQSARYNSFITGFAEGFQKSELKMYRWLLLPVLAADAEDLEKGLPWSTIQKTIDMYHPKSPVNQGNITQALQSTASLQVRLNIKPIILDYDQSTRRLNVVDRSFLIWLKYQAKKDLAVAAGLSECILQACHLRGPKPGGDSNARRSAH